MSLHINAKSFNQIETDWSIVSGKKILFSSLQQLWIFRFLFGDKVFTDRKKGLSCIKPLSLGFRNTTHYSSFFFIFFFFHRFCFYMIWHTRKKMRNCESLESCEMHDVLGIIGDVFLRPLRYYFISKNYSTMFFTIMLHRYVTNQLLLQYTLYSLLFYCFATIASWH